MTTSQVAYVTNTIDISDTVRAVSVVQPYEIYSVTKPDTLADPSWHPDGTSLIFVAQSGGNYAIATMNIGATPNYTEVYTDGTTAFADPTYSVDGSYILFSAEINPGEWALYYMRADGIDVRTILSDGNANIHPVWVTPSQVAFQWWNGSTSQISLIGLGGQGRQDLGEGEYPRTVVQ